MQAYLESASGSRMLSLVRCRATVQLLLVQTCGDVHSQHWQRMPTAALLTMLDLLHFISDTSRDLDADMDLRRQLASRQAEGQVSNLMKFIGSLASCIELIHVWNVCWILVAIELKAFWLVDLVILVPTRSLVLPSRATHNVHLILILAAGCILLLLVQKHCFQDHLDDQERLHANAKHKAGAQSPHSIDFTTRTVMIACHAVTAELAVLPEKHLY